jgi:hypothetical protein
VSSEPYVLSESEELCPGAADQAKSIKVLSEEFNLSRTGTACAQMRWKQSRMVPPMILRDLMRHASVETTKKYYIGVNAKKTVEAIRQYRQTAKGDTSGDTSTKAEQANDA